MTAAPKKKPKDSQAIDMMIEANRTFRFQMGAETIQGDWDLEDKVGRKR